MELINQKYTIGTIPILAIAEKYGSPVYVYDADKMESQYNRLLQAFEGASVKINYACKALTNVSVLKVFKKLGAGVDTVSIQEIKLGLLAGFAPSDIIFTPNCVGLAELTEAIELGVKINIDSLSILEKFGAKYGHTKPVGIRIKPDVMGGGHKKISTGHVDSKFGIAVDQLDAILDIIKTFNLKIEGLHLHTGSDILDIEAFVKSADTMFKTAKYFKGLEYIDFGGGFKVSYKQDDYTTDVEYLGRLFSKRFNEFCKEYGSELTLYFEPGKFLVSEAGYFVTKVNVIKPSKNTTFACINSGMNHLIRPMYYDAYHHITNISKPGAPLKTYSVVGYICETDSFAWNREISEIDEGDYLVFHNAGAYCFSMASNYNSRLLPAEILIYQGKDYLIRKAQTFEDLTVNLEIPELGK
jgi:diaminopimelate decarboxylase